MNSYKEYIANRGFLDPASNPLIFPRTQRYDHNVLKGLSKGLKGLRINKMACDYVMMLAIEHNRFALLEVVLRYGADFNEIYHQPTAPSYWISYDANLLEPKGCVLGYAIKKIRNLYDIDTALILMRYGASIPENNPLNESYEDYIQILNDKIAQTHNKELIFKMNILKSVLFLKTNKLEFDEALIQSANDNLEEISKYINQSNIYDVAKSYKDRKNILDLGLESSIVGLNLPKSNTVHSDLNVTIDDWGDRNNLQEIEINGRTLSDPLLQQIVLNSAYLETEQNSQKSHLIINKPQEVREIKATPVAPVSDFKDLFDDSTNKNVEYQSNILAENQSERQLKSIKTMIDNKYLPPNVLENIIDSFVLTDSNVDNDVLYLMNEALESKLISEKEYVGLSERFNSKKSSNKNEAQNEPQSTPTFKL